MYVRNNQSGPKKIDIYKEVKTKGREAETNRQILRLMMEVQPESCQRNKTRFISKRDTALPRKS